MQKPPPVRDVQIAVLIGSVLAGIFVCAILWEFLIESLADGAQQASTAEHWQNVLSATVIAAIALIFPVVFMHRCLLRRDRAETAYRDFAAMASDWLWETDEKHRFVHFSPDADRVDANSSGANLGITRFDRRLASDRDDEKWRRHGADLDAHRPFKNFEFPLKVADESVRHIRVSGRPIFSPEGKFIGYRGTGTDITEQMEASSKLRRREKEFRALLESAPDAMVISGSDGVIVHVNAQAEALFGYDRQELIGKPIEELVPESLRGRHLTHHEHYLANPGVRSMGAGLELLACKKDGGTVPVEISLSAIRTSERQLVAASVRDITERKRDQEKTLALIAEKDREARTRQIAEKERDQAMGRLTEAIESISEGFAIWASDDRLVMCNSRYLEGFHELSDILKPGVHFEDFLRAAVERGVYDAGDRPIDDFIRERLKEHRNPDGAFERRLGDKRWLRISKRRTDSGGIVGIWTDITEGKKAEETIRDLALNDPLTGLANRNRFHQCLKEAIASAKRLDTHVALLFLDLDGFKRVNDEIGHPGGDALLKQVARRFTAPTRETDTVARLGGDEFAIIMTNTTGADASSLLAKRILDGMARPFSVNGQDVMSGTSIGISIYPDDDTEVDGLIRKADLALYQAKNLGRGTFQLYDEEMHSVVRRAREIETELRGALARNELVLHYQPQLDIAGSKVTGAEALVRWRHPDRGLLAPAEFIDVAEASGLIVQIGDWVLGEACAQSRRWSAAGLPALRIAVNISARQFRSDDLVETVRRVLNDTGVEPGLIELEITESMIMHDIEQTSERLARLTDLGLEIAIDDFGTGYSSLAYLKQFPVQRLKIDKSFVAMLEAESDDAAIVEAIIRLGHSLRLKITAEGVETSQQLATLRALGCDEVQGYYFAKPMPANEFSDWLSARRQPQKAEPSDALA